MQSGRLLAFLPVLAIVPSSCGPREQSEVPAPQVHEKEVVGTGADQGVAPPHREPAEVPQAAAQEPAPPPLQRLHAATQLDHDWFTTLTASDPGCPQAAETLGGQSEGQWESLGYVRQADGRYLQQAATM